MAAAFARAPARRDHRPKVPLALWPALPGRLDPSRQLVEPRATERRQIRRHGLGQVERGHHVGHHAHVRRERPGLGHGPQHQVTLAIVGQFQVVRLDQLHQVGLGHV
jgi:hypothetical protein